jgi:carbohydrate-binding DOMON domain-containing protein
VYPEEVAPAEDGLTHTHTHTYTHIHTHTHTHIHTHTILYPEEVAPAEDGLMALLVGGGALEGVTLSLVGLGLVMESIF